MKITRKFSGNKAKCIFKYRKKLIINDCTAILSNNERNFDLLGDLMGCRSEVTFPCMVREFSKNLVDNASVIIKVWRFDGTLIKFSKYAEKITGFNEAEVLGEGWKNTFADEEIADNIIHLLKEMGEGRGAEDSESEGRLLCKDGKYLNILWSNYLMYDKEGSPEFVVSMGMDITEDKLIREELMKSEERYRLAVQGASDGLWDWNLLTNDIYLAPRCKEILGYEEHEIINHWDYWKKLIHPDKFQNMMKVIQEHLDNKTDFYECETKLRTKSGEYKWILSRGRAVWDEKGQSIRLAGSNTDISKRKAAEDIIYKMAYYDELTGLPNRALISERISSELTNAKKNGTKIALLYMDLDNFKSINDTMGHAVGDKLLKTVGELIEDVIGDFENAARLGGDEFIFLISNVNNQETIVNFAKEIKKIFNRSVTIGEKELFVSGSIGIAVYPDDGNDFDTLLKNADTAMYYAKELGKNRYEFFTKEMNDRVVEKLDLENSLRRAVESNEFIVFYQPQINLKTGKIDGMEALVRWNHPHKGMIPPMKFIPLAEETGLIIPIGRMVLYKACRQNKVWHMLGYSHLRVAVNLSVKQFEQDDLVETIKAALDETGMQPEFLEVEITESIVMKNFEFSIRVLKKLKEMGIHVSLDDFGTGYSSLNYLKLLPIDTLKIDKSFVDNITVDYNDEIIAKAVIDLAHKMQLEVIAEGVEYAEQLNFLKEHSCDKTQGFLFSKPVSSLEFEELLKNKRTYYGDS